ncbi:MAG: XTP/dITP diphosphatase [Thermodesulfobacteriota bacterium]|nr:XTP/dITP diphosphatase [Thermodesulfobacteriota bacterium]
MEALKDRKKDAPIELVIATRNPGKLREIEAILAHLPLKLLSLEDFPDIPDVVEDGTTFAENAGKKASTIARLTGRLAIADDSGLSVKALKGRPGIFSARFAGNEATDQERYQKLLDEMLGIPDGQRQAAFVCAMAIFSPDGETQFVEGKIQGWITFAPQGEYGFGYDPVFFIPEFGKTMAELEPEVKNRISHRARALEKLKLILPKFLPP